jgi:hypothetical protein
VVIVKNTASMVKAEFIIASSKKYFSKSRRSSASLIRLKLPGVNIGWIKIYLAAIWANSRRDRDDFEIQHVQENAHTQLLKPLLIDVNPGSIAEIK